MILIYIKEYVKDGYYKDVIDREVWASSYIGSKVAIPHAAQVNNIIKPCVGISILKNPIEWDEGKVSVVFVLALGSEQKNLFLKIYNTVKETDMIVKIEKLNENNKVIENILSYARGIS